MRPTKAIVDLQDITYNYNQVIATANGAKVMWILKANAYGHGYLRIAHHLQALDASYLGVAYLEEGIALRESGIEVPILVLGGIANQQIPSYIKYNLTITAPSIGKLQAIDQIAKHLNTRAKVHLKIDTGMERIGVHYFNADQLIQESLKCKYVETEGIYTHLAQADSENSAYTNLQLQRWDKIISTLPKNHNYILHAANSGAIVQFPQAKYDMVRCGLMLYGIYPATHLKSHIDLRPALSLKSQIVYFKIVPANHPVSYGGTWSKSEDTRVVTIPMGYGDGYMRSISGQGQVIINDKIYPIIGRICMDQLMVDISEDSAYNGDEVTLIGSSKTQNISVEDVATWAGTIPWEILTSINDRVPRIYV